LEARAVRAGAQASCGNGGHAGIDANPDERRKLAQANFNKSW
jgi:hypothetical protein